MMVLAGILTAGISSMHAQQSSSAAAHASAGWKAFEEGRITEAKPQLEEAVKLAPKDADYLAALAEVESKLGEQDLAIRHFKEAILIKPSDTEFRLDLAQILQQQGNDRDALRFLAVAHPAPALSDALHFSRGFSLFRLGNLEEAHSEFQAVVEKPKFRAPASFFLGNIEYTRGRFADAEPYLSTAVQLGNVEGNKAYNAYAYDYGLVLFKLGRYAEADRQFKTSIVEYDKDPLPWMFRGRCEEQLGNYSEAIEMLETSIKKDSTFQLAYYELARLQQRHGDPQRAAELFKEIGAMKEEEVRNEEQRAARLKNAPRPQ